MEGSRRLVQLDGEFGWYEVLSSIHRSSGIDILLRR